MAWSELPIKGHGMYEVSDERIWGVVKEKLEKWLGRVASNIYHNILRKVRDEMNINKEQFEAALKKLTDAYDAKISAMQTQIDNLSAPAPQDFSIPAQDALNAAAKVDPTISTDLSSLVPVEAQPVAAAQ